MIPIEAGAQTIFQKRSINAKSVGCRRFPRNVTKSVLGLIGYLYGVGRSGGSIGDLRIGELHGSLIREFGADALVAQLSDGSTKFKIIYYLVIFHP